MTDEYEETDVLIVGGAMVGLSLAVFLAWQGMRPLLVERHPGLLIHPRARGVNPRTVEIYRQVGLEQELLDARARGTVGAEQADQMLLAATLASTEFMLEDLGAEDAGRISPCAWCPIDQDRLEVVLRARAEKLGADVRFSTELVSFVQDPEGITAVLLDRNTDTKRTVRARYLVAADGYRSAVRESLGIPVHGPGLLTETISVVFEADLSDVLRGRRVGLAYLNTPAPGTVLFPHDGVRSWCFSTPYGRDETLADYPEERCIDLIRAAIGVPDLNVRLLPQIPESDTTVLGFTIGAQTAQSFVAGRVLLVGDAAKQVPPTGAFGGNAGIQEAHNLAWKLVAVLRGQAGPKLLDTYHAERSAVAQLSLQQAMAHMAGRSGELGNGPVPPMLDYWAVVFGYRYRSAAVLPDGPDDGEPALKPQLLTGEPGTRAPHVMVERNGTALSTLDLFGRHFVLLAGPDGEGWPAAVGTVGRDLGIELDCYLVGTDVTDVTGSWAGSYGVNAGGAVLVRPDGFVAWRATQASDTPAAELAAALGQLLHREQALVPESSRMR
ncbi:MAG: FAD-dependent monooxygenase [Pseudonocardiaceae bacterium]